MSVSVHVPWPLRKLIDGKSEVQVEGSTLREVIANLATQNEDFTSLLLDNNGKLRRYVNFWVNEEEVRSLQDIDTPVKDGDEIFIAPAVIGGR